MNISKEKCIEIVKTNNGFVIKTYAWESNDKHGNKVFTEEVEVIEEKQTEKETMTNLLLTIADLCGFRYDGFSKDNLNITWDKKGDELE